MHLHLNVHHQGLLSGFQNYGIYKSYPSVLGKNIKLIHILCNLHVYFTYNCFDILQ
jgi:hypothetical protein